MQTKTNTTQPKQAERNASNALREVLTRDELVSIQLLFESLPLHTIQLALEEQFEAVLVQSQQCSTTVPVAEMYYIKKMLNRLVRNMYTLYTRNLDVMNDTIVFDIMIDETLTA